MIELELARELRSNWLFRGVQKVRRTNLEQIYAATCQSVSRLARFVPLPGHLPRLSFTPSSLAMGSNYVFSLQPTFTQGLILGQLSILVLLALILKYLFVDSSETPVETSSYHPRLDNEPSMRSHRRLASCDDDDEANETSNESADWFNMILHQVRFIQ